MSDAKGNFQELELYRKSDWKKVVYECVRKEVFHDADLDGRCLHIKCWF